jgi:hypothetical protein
MIRLGAENTSARRSQRLSRGKLRPRIRLIDEAALEMSNETLAFDTIPDVLLVVGADLGVGQVRDVVSQLADTFHSAARRVIYVGLDKPAKTSWGSQFDVCLQVNVQEWAKRQLAAFKSERFDQLNGCDTLEAVSNHELTDVAPSR